MNYKTKNTIYLTLVLILISGLVYYQLKKIHDEMVIIDELLRRNHTELRDPKYFQPDDFRLLWMDAKLEHMENWTIENSKFFLAEDDSKITWEYLQEIVNRFDENFQFNFVVTNRGGTPEYAISGSVRVMYLYVFINYLEKLGALYTIETVTLTQSFKESDEGPVNDVSFSINLRPWVDRAVGQDLPRTPLRRISYNYIMRDPFRPAIHTPMRDPVQEQFIDYTQLNLIGFSNNQGFFSAENQTVISLNPMQRVAYGYFSHIDQRNSRAVFRINRTGLFENVYHNLTTQ